MFHYPAPTTILTHMETAPYKFYLTGSRFFGGATKASDTDYFVQNAPLLHEFFTRNGFTQLQMSSTYTDQLLVELWIHPLERIHVQVVSDAPLKLAAQELLKSPPWSTLYAPLSKMTRRDLWNIAIQYCKEKR